MSETYITPPELADRLRVKPSRIVEMIRSGELRAVDVSRPGSRRPRFRIPQSAILDWELGRTVRPAEKRARRRRADRNDSIIKFYGG